MKLLSIPVLIVLLNMHMCGGRSSGEFYSLENDIERYGLTGKKYYEINHKRIYPSEKKIAEIRSVYRGRVPRGMALWVDTVNFDSTALVFYGNRIELEDYVNYDTQTLEVLFYEIDDSRRNVLCIDKNTKFKLGFNTNSPQVAMADMARLNNRVYQAENGDMYFISEVDSRIMFKIHNVNQINFDWETLQHISNDYFCDINGLYRFVKQYSPEILAIPVKLENAITEPNPLNGRFYLTYGNTVYLKEQAGIYKTPAQKLPLDARKLKEYLISDFYDYVAIITDGNNQYVYGRDEYKDNLGTLRSIDFSNCTQLTKSNANFYFDKSSATLYYSTEESKPVKLENIQGALFKFNNRYKLFKYNNYTLVDVNKVMIYTNGYHELEFEKYKYIAQSLYIYDGKLYGNRCKYLGPESDFVNLAQIKHNGLGSNYFTNNKKLYYYNYHDFCTIQGYNNSLKIVTSNIMIDNNYIYDECNVIPRDSLGLQIKSYN